MTGRTLAKLATCRARVAKVTEALPVRPEDVLDDERLESFLSFQILLTIQDAVDLATSLVADRGLGVPASQREAFELLAQAGVIDARVAREMGDVAALRNRIAHTYGDVDPVRLVREAPEGLRRVASFLDAVAGVLSP